jgi:hypothetical protein
MPDATLGPVALGKKAKRTRLAREMPFAFPSRSAPWLSNGHINSPQSDHPLMKYIVEITASGPES